MNSFWGELKRRNVFKVGAAYLIVAWLVMQVADVVLPTFEAPAWVMQVLVLFLVLGFPIAVVLAWAFEMTPSGLKSQSIVDQTEGAADSRGKTLNYIVVAGLVLALALMVLYVFVPTDDEAPLAENADVSELAAERVSAQADARARASRPVLPNSVAVLPFANLSPDPDKAYFAAGIHEEILNHLAKIADLTVIARTSVLQYAGSVKPIPEIAAELNVQSVMEGSVRYAGDEVRITAQLIDPATGGHLWSETYQRELENIFEIETDIATSIAMALEAELLPEERQRLELSPTESTEAYELYLRAAAVGQGPGVEARLRESAQALLDRSLMIDPLFADAYALKARLYSASLSFDPVPAEDTEAYLAELFRTIAVNAQRAIDLNPNLSLPFQVLGDNFAKQLRGNDAQTAFDRALLLAPNDVGTLIETAWQDLYTEDFAAANRKVERALELSPSDAEVLGRAAMVHRFSGDFERALAEAREAVAAAPSGNSYLDIAALELQRGNVEASRQALQSAEVLLPDAQYPLSVLAYEYAQAGSAGAAQRVLERLRAHSKTYHVDDLAWALAALAVGDREEALRRLTGEAESDFVDGSNTHRALVKSNVWRDSVLDEPEFAAVRARLGLR